ncbi:MAG: 50S ribosomal protein L10 [Saprospiraceae bacterium]|nr:50S ribosomal protein L10 [Saprospiraceae bacterium]|tara:strand:+ start:1933 stop:2463 length:531 start_codon:yes stop_codon:yes gene_type:complete
MTRTEKETQIEELKNKFDANPYFYITDSSTLTVEQVNELRGLCYKEDIEIRVVKNTLAIKALEALPADKGFDGLFGSLKGPTTLMFSDVANKPAKVIKEFRKKSEKPVLKAAYIESAIYEGDNQVDALAALKSKEELIGDVILLLQSPIKNVLGSLNSGGQTISGLLKALEQRAQG